MYIKYAVGSMLNMRYQVGLWYRSPRGGGGAVHRRCTTKSVGKAYTARHLAAAWRPACFCCCYC